MLSKSSINFIYASKEVRRHITSDLLRDLDCDNEYLNKEIFLLFRELGKLPCIKGECFSCRNIGEDDIVDPRSG